MTCPTFSEAITGNERVGVSLNESDLNAGVAFMFLSERIEERPQVRRRTVPTRPLSDPSSCNGSARLDVIDRTQKLAHDRVE